MSEENKGDTFPIPMKIISSVISWDPDDAVGENYAEYFKEAIEEKLNGIAHLAIKPGYESADLELLNGLEWEFETLEVDNEFILEGAAPVHSNPFLDAPSYEFNYRVVIHLDLSAVISEDNVEILTSPEIYVNELCEFITIGIYEFPYSTEISEFEYDSEIGRSLVPIDMIEFMGGTYDIVIEDI